MSRATATRERLQTAAVKLFTERGFDAVTVDEIAASAGVSHMTFFRYFPTKESVVMDDPYDPVIAQAVLDQPSTLSALNRVRLGFMNAAGAVDDDEEMVRQRIQLAATHPKLRASLWDNNYRTEQAVVEVLVADGVHAVDAKVAVGAVLGAITAGLLAWAESDDSLSIAECLGRALVQFDLSEAATP